MRSAPPLLALALLAAVSLGSCARSQEEPQLEPLEPRQVRVTWTTDPQTTATVSWSTRDPGDTSYVLIGQSRDTVRDRERCRRVDAQRSGAFSAPGDAPALHYHHARVDRLEPSTTYWFTAVTGDRAGPLRHFRTAPAKDRAFSILSGGDSRTDRENRQRMNRRIAAIAAARDDVIALAHGGDYVTNGLDLDLWNAWLDDHELTVTEDGRILPVIPARGNHEARGPLFDEVFDHPGGEGAVNWFATSLSEEVLLVTLSSETAASGDQREFLAATLAANSDRRWKLVQYHRPLFPAVKTPGRAKSHWQPLFDEHRVDLVMESDGHALKRTVPILGDEQDPDGVVYIGEGGLGVAQRRVEDDRWYLESPGIAKSAHHVWVVGIAEREITLEAIGIDGDVLDLATIRARAARD